MCGRATLTRGFSPELAALLNRLAIRLAEDIESQVRPRYNISPEQECWLIAPGDDSLEFKPLRWGLSHWQKGKRAIINATCEKVATSRFFAPGFRRGRSIFVTDGYIEWQKTEAGAKQPYHFRRPDKGLVLMPAIVKGDRFAVVTCPASQDLKFIHHRMPAVLGNNGVDGWLNDGESAEKLLVTPPAGTFEVIPVSRTVNSSRNEGPECLREVE